MLIFKLKIKMFIIYYIIILKLRMSLEYLKHLFITKYDEIYNVNNKINKINKYYGIICLFKTRWRGS